MFLDMWQEIAHTSQLHAPCKSSVTSQREVLQPLAIKKRKEEEKKVKLKPGNQGKNVKIRYPCSICSSKPKRKMLAKS